MTATQQPLPRPDLIPAFSAARRRARVMPAHHPYVTKALHELLEKIEDTLHHAPSLTLSILGSEIYLDGHLMADESIAFAHLVHDLLERELDSVVFSPGLTLDELAQFIDLTNQNANELGGRGGWKSILEQAAIAHIGTGQVAGLEERHAGHGVNMQVAHEAYQVSLESIIASFNAVREGHAFDVRTIQQRVKMLLAVLMDDQQIFQSLSVIKSKDQYTFYHSINVGVLSLLIGSKLNLDPQLLEWVGAAAILHDIGKMRIPLEILNKPTELSKEEWGIMQTHAVEGAKILLQEPGLQTLPMVVAAQHHAEHKLGGYPRLPGLDRLHMLTEIVSIADVFDALTSDRAYRKAMQPDHAMKIITGGSGTRFHPVLVKVFAQLSGMFPVGTLVELDSGELAVVVRPNPNDLLRPGVRILRTAIGAHADRRAVELSETDAHNEYKRSIVRSVDPAKYNLHIPSLIVGLVPRAQQQ